MQRLTAFFFAALLLAPACSPERRLQRQLRRYADDLQSATPIRPDTAGRYSPGTELDVLDGLLRKYPGKVNERTIIRTETVTVPSRASETTLPVRPDVARNVRERDSLLAELTRLTSTERADSEVKAELARLKSSLLQALNRRGCLPDTTVYFPDQGQTLKVRRLSQNVYRFELIADGQQITYPVEVREVVHQRIVHTEKRFWTYWQSWLLLALLVGASVFIVRLLVRPHKFYFTSGSGA